MKVLTDIGAPLGERIVLDKEIQPVILNILLTKNIFLLTYVWIKFGNDFLASRVQIG